MLSLIRLRKLVSTLLTTSNTRKQANSTLLTVSKLTINIVRAHKKFKVCLRFQQLLTASTLGEFLNFVTNNGRKKRSQDVMDLAAGGGLRFL